MTTTAKLSELLHRIFHQGGLNSPLSNVHLICDDHNLILTGSVPRFDYVRLAIDIARKYAQGRHVDIRLDVNCSKLERDAKTSTN